MKIPITEHPVSGIMTCIERDFSNPPTFPCDGYKKLNARVSQVIPDKRTLVIIERSISSNKREKEGEEEEEERGESG